MLFLLCLDAGSARCPRPLVRCAHILHKKECLKQNQWGTLKIWWAPVLVRGKLHVVPLPEDFPGESPEGAAILAAKLLSVLKKRFPNEALPRIVYTDRGKGFFDLSGKITPAWDAGLTAAGLRPYQGQDASSQPGKMGDTLLHETAVSWLKAGLTETTPRRPHEETREQFFQRFTQVCAKANKTHDIEGLCQRWPDRLRDVVAKKGDVLSN